MPPKCLYCKSFGHIRRNCGKLKLHCTKCNRNGHDASKCNLANRTAPPQAHSDCLGEENIEDEIILDKNNDETTEHNSNNTQTNETETKGSTTLVFGDGVFNEGQFKIPDSSNDSTVEIKKEQIFHASSIRNNFLAKSSATLEELQKKRAAAEKKLKKLKKKREDEAFDLAIAEIEKKGFPRHAALLEFEKMNEAAKNAVLEKCTVIVKTTANKRKEGMLTSNKQKSSKTDDFDGETTEGLTDVEEFIKSFV